MLDFSGFDRHIPSWLIRDVFSMLKGFFDLNDDDQRQWKAMVDYFVDTPLLLGRWLVRSSGGIPSGSCWTQFVDSIINIVMNVTSLMALSTRDASSYESLSDVCRIVVLGDDSVIIPKVCHLEQDLMKSHVAFLRRYFNSIVNVDKSKKYSKFDLETLDLPQPMLHFLGKSVCSQYITADEKQVVLSLALPEETDVSPGDVLTRIIGLAWTSGTNRAFHEFLDWIFKWIKQKYPDIEPTPWKRFQLAQLKFEFLQLGFIPDLIFPSMETVFDRYDFPLAHGFWITPRPAEFSVFSLLNKLKGSALQEH